MNVLVTGARGMIGSRLVRGLLDAGYGVIGVGRSGDEVCENNHSYYRVDLADREKLKAVVERSAVDRVIHLAALAHTAGEADLSWERYRHINVDCARNVFDAAGERPVLYISTVDVYGFYDGKEAVNGDTPIHPVSRYGKSKAMAEELCRRLSHYTIFRLSPVYTETVKRDIQKRYYLRCPTVAYQIGKGTRFEILSVENAVRAMVDWCREEPQNDVRIIKDDRPMWTPDYIRAEQAEGRAKLVLCFPRWMVSAGYGVLRRVLGENEKVYLLNKAVYPLRSE